MVSGKCVKCLDRALGERWKLRWGNYRAAIFFLIACNLILEERCRGEVRRVRGIRWGLWGSTQSHRVCRDGPQTMTWSYAPSWSTQNQPISLENCVYDATMRVGMLFFFCRSRVPLGACVYVLSYMLKSLPLLHTWNSIFHWCSAEAFKLQQRMRVFSGM